MLSRQDGPSAALGDNPRRLAESFDRIVPGMTQAQDLPGLGFDTRPGHMDMLSAADIESRFPSTANSDPAVRACLRAEPYCTGFVFHSGRQHDVTLLVMNGRVVHKVFAPVMG
ncbi:MAG TPA: hypothetical protein VGM26_05470 [Rhizomicrobium sp.]